jgi:hypothetical protein
MFEIIMEDLKESSKLQVGDDVTIQDDTDEYCQAQAVIIALEGTTATLEIQGYEDADHHDGFMEKHYDRLPIEKYHIWVLRKIYWS